MSTHKKQFNVAGRLLLELSRNIPSFEVAINEIMKNSYDADATLFTINISRINKTISFIDNGTGMDLEDIDSLLTIANSKKKFGHLRKNARRTLGSKGLGFLTSMKFGSTVNWVTCKDSIKRGFTLHLDSLVSEQYITKVDLLITEEACTEQGTSITISSDAYIVNTLADLLALDKRFNEKIKYAFKADDMIINIIIDGVNITIDERKNIDDFLLDKSLVKMKYDSETNIAEYYHHNSLIHSFQMISPAINGLSFKIDVVNYSLPGNGTKSFPGLFRRSDSDDNRLTLITYINGNIFYNFDLFDTEINAKKSGSETKRQMIGYINITIEESSSDFEFNIDRSSWVSNEKLNELIKFLDEINSKYQKESSQLKPFFCKNCFIDESRVKKLKYEDDDSEFVACIRNFICSNSVKIERDSQLREVKFSFADYTSTFRFAPIQNAQGTITTGAIVLKKNTDSIAIPNRHINLLDYVDSITPGSSSLIVDKSSLIVKIDGVLSDGTFYQCKDQKTFDIEYSFIDNDGTLVSSNLSITTIHPQTPAVVISSPARTRTIHYPDFDGVYTSASITYDARIQNLLTILESINNTNIDLVWAISLRGVIDILCDVLRFHLYSKSIFSKETETLKCIGKLLEYVDQNPRITAISSQYHISYHTLSNSITNERGKLDRIWAIANLGAHKSNSYISTADIDELTLSVSLYLFLSECIFSKLV